MPDREERDRILDANIKYHRALAKEYDKKQPHYKPENVQRVTEIIERLSITHGDSLLMDLGCGSGFIINIAKKYFKKVVGVDITPDMLTLVDCSGGDIELIEADTNAVPYGDETVDVCTAYSFLHHLHELESTFREAYRLLKKGGCFYSGLDPNMYYWRKMEEIKGEDIVSDVIRREINATMNAEKETNDLYGVDPSLVTLAEYQKTVRGGFQEHHICEMLTEIGFSTVEYCYEWFLGQASYIHENRDDGEVIMRYLTEMLPATRDLFKYITIIAVK